MCLQFSYIVSKQLQPAVLLSGTMLRTLPDALWPDAWHSVGILLELIVGQKMALWFAMACPMLHLLSARSGCKQRVQLIRFFLRC